MLDQVGFRDTRSVNIQKFKIMQQQLQRTLAERVPATTETLATVRTLESEGTLEIAGITEPERTLRQQGSQQQQGLPRQKGLKQQHRHKKQTAKVIDVSNCHSGRHACYSRIVNNSSDVSKRTTSETAGIPAREEKEAHLRPQH
jgi:hypothetical protein